MANGDEGSDTGRSVTFYDGHRPGLAPGEYRLSVTQCIKIDGEKGSDTTYSAEYRFAVQGQRLALQPSDIVAVYPPEGSAGDHGEVLPHIVLRRSTLPWERDPRAGNPPSTGESGGESPPPWLALLVFDESEKPALLTATSQNGGTTAAGQQPEAHSISLSKDVFMKLLPANLDDLRYLAHVREFTDGQGVKQTVSVVIGNRVPVSGGTTTVHLVSVEGRYDPENMKLIEPSNGKDVPLTSFKSWTFTCPPEPGDFATLVGKLDLQPAVLPLPSRENAADDSTRDDVKPWLAHGAVPLPHEFRRGGTTVSWYRGPLAPGVSNESSANRVRSADALLRYDSSTGLFDVSYAAAWELGRLLTLRSKAASVALFLWRRGCAQQWHRINQAANGPALPGNKSANGDCDPPPEVKRWFESLRNLADIPLNYLVPDERLLPIESIRFYHIDEFWVSCLLDGAASIGRVSDAEMNRERPLDTLIGSGQKDRSAILIRSSVVSGWPGLQVDATAANVSCKRLRFDRIAPGVLLGIFEGVFDRVKIHLPPEQMHFGFDAYKEKPKAGEVFSAATWAGKLHPSSPSPAWLASRLLAKVPSVTFVARKGS
ncbi:MAG: hypothetical protein ACLQGP_26510 [Isosphaeraceae bacterium]